MREATKRKQVCSIHEFVESVRGIYSRVAQATGVHPSFVSRVARGQRKSEAVEGALAVELKSILERAPKIE